MCTSACNLHHNEHFFQKRTGCNYMRKTAKRLSQISKLFPKKSDEITQHSLHILATTMYT